MKINTGTVARPDEKSEKGGRLLADVARRRSSIEMETRRASGFRSVKWLFLSFACSFPNDNDDDERPPWLRRFHPLPMRSPAKKDRYRINDRHQIPEGYCSCYPFNISPSLFLFFFFVLFFFFIFQSHQLLGYLSSVYRGQFRLHHTSVHQVIYVTVNLPGPPRGYGDRATRKIN